MARATLADIVITEVCTINLPQYKKYLAYTMRQVKKREEERVQKALKRAFAIPMLQKHPFKRELVEFVFLGTINGKKTSRKEVTNLFKKMGKDPTGVEILFQHED